MNTSEYFQDRSMEMEREKKKKKIKLTEIHAILLTNQNFKLERIKSAGTRDLFRVNLRLHIVN